MRVSPGPTRPTEDASGPPNAHCDGAIPGVERAREAHAEPAKQAICSASESDVQEVPGGLSNPARATDTAPSPAPPCAVERRLSTPAVDDICASYVSGSSIDELARAYGVHRTTIIKHLDQRAVPRRVVRKMTDALVAQAAALYRDGHSLATVAREFKVDTRTLGREFRKAAVLVRPRRRWTY